MHNHITRDIKALGSCPGCDAYHIKHVLSAKLAELSSCALDDTDDFRRVLDAVAAATTELIDLDRRSRGMIKETQGD